MKKNSWARIITFVFAIYFIIRSFFFYRQEDDESLFFAKVYFCIGVILILVQLYLNYRNKKSAKKDD